MVTTPQRDELSARAFSEATDIISIVMDSGDVMDSYSLCFLCRWAKAMKASSLEKNLADDNAGSDSTLGLSSPLSWCGIVSLACGIVSLAVHSS